MERRHRGHRHSGGGQVKHSDARATPRCLSVGGTHADTTKELYVNGDIEVTATLDVGTGRVHRWGHRERTGKLAVGGLVRSTATHHRHSCGGTSAFLTHTVLSGTLNAGATTLMSTLDVTGNTEMTGTLWCEWCTDRSNKEL